MSKIKSSIRNFLEDNAGNTEIPSVVVLAMGALSAAAVVIASATMIFKAKLAGVHTDVTTLKVNAPSNINANSTNTTFGTASGSHTITGVTIQN